MMMPVPEFMSYRKSLPTGCRLGVYRNDRTAALTDDPRFARMQFAVLYARAELPGDGVQIDLFWTLYPEILQ